MRLPHLDLSSAKRMPTTDETMTIFYLIVIILNYNFNDFDLKGDRNKD